QAGGIDDRQFRNPDLPGRITSHIFPGLLWIKSQSRIAPRGGHEAGDVKGFLGLIDFAEIEEVEAERDLGWLIGIGRSQRCLPSQRDLALSSSRRAGNGK